ncbi:MAG: AAA family ATPase [Micrococcales bacterium]|nr:AAA family ATPase [Micrococcales bacterium]
MSTPATFPGVRLHVVTGKGGTGKTTVAGALALALARRGKRVLLVEVEGRQGIAQTFDVPPLGTEEERLVSDPSGGEVFGLSIDAKAALLEYLHTFYKLGRAGSVLEKVGAIDFATTIAPGVRDVLLTGKVYEAVGRRTGGRSSTGRNKGGQPIYDAVVLDAPPTGRVVRFLAVNEQLADMAKAGPIRSQADSITEMMRSKETAVHIVTLLEEMPVQETIDAIAELRAERLPVGAIVVNQVREEILDDDELAAVAKAVTQPSPELAEAVRADLTAVGVKATAAMAQGLLTEAAEHADRVALQREQEADVVAQGLPVYRLPSLPDGLDSGGITVLADALGEQGVA